MKTGVRELMSIWLLNYTVRGKYKVICKWQFQFENFTWYHYQPGPRTLTSMQSLSNSPWGGVRGMVGGTRISAAARWCCVHCLQSTVSSASESILGSSTWNYRKRLKKETENILNASGLKTYTHRHTYTLLCFCLCKLQNTWKTDLEPFWFWAVCIYPLVTMISEERFFHSFWHVPVGRWITM